jgi:hypothetical protein
LWNDRKTNLPEIREDGRYLHFCTKIVPTSWLVVTALTTCLDDVTM